MNALGQQMANARGACERRPAPGAGAGLRDRGLRCARARSAPGPARSAASAGAGRRQCQHAHLQFRRRRGRHRLSLRPALPGRHRRRLHPRHAVGEHLHGPGLDRHASASRPTARSRKPASTSMRWRATPTSNNQLQRQILIPGLQQRTATGSDRRQPVPRPGRGRLQARHLRAGRRDHHAVRPLPDLERDAERVQRSRARSRSASTSRSRPPTRCARPSAPISAGSIGLGNERKLDLAVRLGWQHEFADTGRPITAAFAGAPGNSFTVFGATPQRDAAVVGLPASTTIAAATQVYLRYDGEIGGGTDNHALNRRRAHELVGPCAETGIGYSQHP